MTEKLSDLFERAQAASITWQGRTVHSMYEWPGVPGGSLLRIEFDDPSPARAQGLRIKLRGGQLEVGGQSLKDVVLWSDSAPRVVAARLSAKGAANVRMWNCWRDPAGTQQAWIGNAGMLVEETPDGVVLRCSDGFDEPTFDDLIARVRVEKGSP